MNIDNLTKEQLIKYKKLLSELKRAKAVYGINISCTTISLLSFIYFGQSIDLKKMAVSAIIAIAGLNFLPINSEELADVKQRVLDFEENEGKTCTK